MRKAISLSVVIRIRIRRCRQRVQRRFQDAVTRGVSKDMAHVHRLNQSMLTRYRTLPYPGRTVLFRSAEFMNLDAKNFHLEGWSRIAGENLDTRETPGTHITMFEPPHVENLARQLQDCLDHVQV